MNDLQNIMLILGAIAQQLWALIALPEDLGLITYITQCLPTTCSSSSKRSIPNRWPLWTPGTYIWYMGILAGKTITYIRKFKYYAKWKGHSRKVTPCMILLCLCELCRAERGDSEQPGHQGGGHEGAAASSTFLDCILVCLCSGHSIPDTDL